MIDPDETDTKEGAAAIADAPRIRAILIEAARAGESISYSALLAQLGLRFTRPKMRALCRTLGAIDEAGAAAGEPELAVLVVRESDGLPGQGWWVGGRALMLGHEGPWQGPEAQAFVRRIQQEAFDWWGER
ncbi:MAG TPA: ribose-phosphate pyrophosphokinase [Sphingomonas sp.]|nr:ribose-phosphate pyrophosphokinase [Sphingomonas sp.]